MVAHKFHKIIGQCLIKSFRVSPISKSAISQQLHITANPALLKSDLGFEPQYFSSHGLRTDSLANILSLTHDFKLCKNQNAASSPPSLKYKGSINHYDWPTNLLKSGKKMNSALLKPVKIATVRPASNPNGQTDAQVMWHISPEAQKRTFLL